MSPDSKFAKYSLPEYHLVNETENVISCKEYDKQMYPYSNENDLFSNPPHFSYQSNVPSYPVQHDYHVYTGTASGEMLNPQFDNQNFRANLLDKQSPYYSSGVDLNANSLSVPSEQTPAYLPVQASDPAWSLEQMDVFHANDIFALESPLAKHDLHTANSHSMINFSSQHEFAHHSTLFTLPPLVPSDCVQTVVETCPVMSCLDSNQDNDNLSNGEDYVVTFLK